MRACLKDSGPPTFLFFFREDFTVELEIHRRPTASRKQAYAPPPGISLPASTACPESSSPSPWNEEVGGGRVLSGDSCKDALLEEGYMSAGADTTDVGWKRLPRGQVEEEKKMVPKSRKEQAASSSCALEKVSCDVFQEKVHLTIWDLAGGDGLETRWRAMQEVSPRGRAGSVICKGKGEADENGCRRTIHG